MTARTDDDGAASGPKPRAGFAGSGHDTSAAASAPAGDALVGTRVHKYEIVRVIGRGGMGTVYEAVNTAIGKRVAMKFIDAEMARNKDAVARFQREAQAASAVESAHIVEIFDSGYSDDGIPYIVMEMLRGEDLGHRIKRCGRLELAEAVHVGAQILRGLHRAHQAGIVHRDLKPDNVFLVDRDDDANFAKVLDFGISKVRRDGETPVHTLTRQGTVLGTPFYMSPEQAQAQPDVDGRADLWSVGAILYECLTGRPPYRGTTYEQVIVNICMNDADDVRVHNPGVPEAIAHVIARALSRDREDRFPTARSFLDALKAGAGGLVSSRPELVGGEDSSPRFSTPIPRSSKKTPITIPGSAHGPIDESGPTMEARTDVASPRAGWSTNRGHAARREKRTFFIVAVSALVAGGLGAFLVVRSQRGAATDQGATQGTAQATPLAEVAVHLRSNAPNARFLVDGAPLAGDVLKGQRGAVKRVRIEADGFTPEEREVRLEGTEGPIDIVLAALENAAPTVAPAAITAAAEMPDAKKQGKPAVIQTGVKPVAPRPSDTAVQQPAGVASGLKLKTE